MSMIPAGYLLKRVAPLPDWLSVANVTEVCSVANCANDDVVDVQKAWAHKSLGVANSPEILERLAREQDADMTAAQLFYYEAL